MKKVFILITCIVGILHQTSSGQSAAENLQKYWKYRERLKNTTVIGNCQGCSIPSKGRQTGSSFDGDLDFSDSGIRLGEYIAVLASEYALLKAHNQPMDGIRKELFFAIEAVNRVDKNAETYWQKYYNKNLNYTPSYTNGIYDDLNGFFIRDDVPKNFKDLVDNDGELIENKLNGGLYGPDEGHQTKIFTSAFTDGIGNGFGPVEESVDQAVQLFMGFSLVAKLIGPLETYDANFSDKRIYFVDEVKALARRMINHMRNPFDTWDITNPAVSNGCVQGTVSCGQKHGRSCGFLNWCGAYAEPLSWGFSISNCYIQSTYSNNTLYSNCIDDIKKYDWKAWLNKLNWKSIFYMPSYNKEYHILTLAAISRVWDNNTDNSLNKRCKNSSDLNHLPLLHSVLFPGAYNNNFVPSFYECVLNAAPCDGPRANTGNVEWSGEDRMIYGTWDGSNYDVEWNGMAYMLYFNLYNIANPNYLGNNYVYIRPQDLCAATLLKSSYTESDKKNFIAYNNITAGKLGSISNYIIENDNDPLQACSSCPCPLCARAQVTFTTAHSVDMQPGFEVKTGSLFTAIIDQSFKAATCSYFSNISCSSKILKLMSNDSKLYRAPVEEAQEMENTVADDVVLDFNIVPNPSNGIFEITELPHDFNGEAVFYDILGNIILQESITGESKLLDITQHSKGIYYLKIKNDSGEFVVKKVVYQ